MYTPSFALLRNKPYSCGSERHDMRLTSVKCGWERGGCLPARVFGFRSFEVDTSFASRRVTRVLDGIVAGAFSVCFRPKTHVARTPPRSPSCPEFLYGAAASPRVTAQVGNDRQRQGKELHSSSMLSYPPKGINKFTFVNLAVSLQQPDRKDFLLAASFSAGSPTATPGCCAAPILG
jgi:hypothetical protein